MPHPSLLLTAEPIPGLRSLSEVRASLTHPRIQPLWDRLRQQVEADLARPPHTPRTELPDRVPGQAAAANADYHIVAAAGGRVQRAALAHLLTGDARFRDDALRQLECLFDEQHWPRWCDQSHPGPTDLRTGQFLRFIGLAYDWLHPALDDRLRRWIVEQLDRRAIQPYLQSLEQKP